MLSGLFGKKSDHPMADIKSAQALLDDLPKTDALKSVMELSEWLESVGGNSEFKLEHQFAVLRLLDETAQPHARKLVREYFSMRDLDKFHENRLWLVLGNLARHTASAYCSVFDRYCRDGSSAIKPHLPLLAARAANNICGQLKYLCAHYGPVDSWIWERLAQLYAHAERHQYLDVPLALYPGMSGNTSVRGEAAHLLGWYGCGVGSLSPLYMHLTERILAAYSSVIDIHAEQRAHDLFCFDLNKPGAPVRVKVDGAMQGGQTSLRFVGMEALASGLEGLNLSLSKGGVPEAINLGANYETEPVRGAVRYLLDYLNEPPLRRSKRRGVRVDLSVLNGFARVLEHTEVGLNFSEEPPAHWSVEDISSSGFHAVSPVPGSDAIRIGSLLGMQPDGVEHWGVAVVRRLMRDDTGLLHVGAEMLSSRIGGVVLQSSGANGADDGQAALWLYADACGADDGEVCLLMKADTFSGKRSLQTRLGARSYLLIPGGLKEKGYDYDLARFRAIEQEAGED